MLESMDKKIVLVSGVGGPAGINIVRLLKQKFGDNVELIGCDIDALAAGQNFVDEFLLCPRVSDEVAYRQWLEQIIEERKIALFIPTVDEELVPLAKFADTLNCFVVLSPVQTLQIASDKLASYKFVAENLPAHSPKHISLSEWNRDWSVEDFLFVKPRQGRGARGCRLTSQTELEWIKSNSDNPEDLIVMENLPGQEWTVDAYVGKSGEIVYLVPRERLALSGGISIKGRTVKNESVINATKLLLEQLSCRGPVCVQWKQDKNGLPKFVEINPRLSGGLMISVLSGIDPVNALWSDLEDSAHSLQEWREVTVVGHLEYKEINF